MNSSRSSDDADGTERRVGQPPKPGVALSLSILLFGLAIVGVGTYLYLGESAALDSTSEVTAEITDTGVEQVKGSRGRTVYVPTVMFRYSFRGVEYTSNKIHPGDSELRFEDRDAAVSRLSAFPAGERVTAYVNPDQPGEAFLENSRSGQSVGAILIGVALSLFSGGRLYQVWGRSRDLEQVP